MTDLIELLRAYIKYHRVVTIPEDDALLREFANRLERLQEWIEGDCACPCCEGVRECLDGCTFAVDAPSDAERMNEARKVLRGD